MLLRNRNLTDATVARVKNIFGEQPTIDLIAVAGSDAMVSSVPIAGRVGILGGSTPPPPVLVRR